MSIGAIQSISSFGGTPAVLAQPVQRPVAGRASAAAAPATPSASAPTGAAATATAPRGGDGGGGSLAPSQAQAASASSAAVAALAAVYSTTVKGTTYSGSVEETNGEYTASIAGLPGASASGASIEAAEDDLAAILDTLA